MPRFDDGKTRFADFTTRSLGEKQISNLSRMATRGSCVRRAPASSYGYRRPLSTVSKRLFRFRSELVSRFPRRGAQRQLQYAYAHARNSAVKCALRISRLSWALCGRCQGSTRAKVVIFTSRRPLYCSSRAAILGLHNAGY